MYDIPKIIKSLFLMNVTWNTNFIGYIYILIFHGKINIIVMRYEEHRI